MSSYCLQAQEVLSECGLNPKLETIRAHEKETEEGKNFTALSQVSGLQPHELSSSLRTFDQKLLDLGAFSVPHITFIYSLSLREKVR